MSKNYSLSWNSKPAPFTLNETAWLPFSSAVDDASVGTRAWNTPENALTDDANAATYASGFGGTGQTHYLKMLNPNPGIQAGSIIAGVELRVRRFNNLGSGSVIDNTVSLVASGVVSGANLADTVNNWPDENDDVSLRTKVYGSRYNLWSLQLTDAIVNAADFGFVLSADVNANFRIATVEYAEMKIYYL